MSTIAMSCGIGGTTLAEVLALADVPEAFEVGEWTLSDPGVGDRVQISINALPSSLGSPLTRVQHNVDGAGWVDFLTPPATGSFDIPVSFAVGQVLNIAIRAQNTTGPGASSDVKSIAPASPFSLTSTAEDEIEVDGIDGTITITIAAPSIYGAYDAGNGPGVFVVDSADKDAGPVNLVPPQISGGDNLTAGASVVTTPGLWIYDGDATMPTTSYRWLRNGAPIPDETGTSYIVQAADVGQQVSVEEISAASNGTRAAISAPILTAGSIAQANPTQGEALSVTGSNASARASYQWQLNGVDVSGATGATFDTTNQPVGEYRRGVRDGMQGLIYTSAVTVVTVAVANAVARHMDEQDRPTVATLSPATQIDVSNRTAGDLLIFAVGSVTTTSGPTVNGNAATVVTTWNWGSAARGGLYSYVLQQADIDVGLVAVTVAVTVSFAGGRTAFDFIITSEGTITDFATHAGTTTSLPMTATKTKNTIYHFIHGESARFSGAGVSYTSVIPSRLYKLDANNHGSAAGIVQDAAVGLNTVTFTIDGSGNYAGVAVVVE